MTEKYIFRFEGFIKESISTEETFTDNDYANWKSYWRKKASQQQNLHTQEEKSAVSKYYRMKKNGIEDPISQAKPDDTSTPFSKNDYLNYKEYVRKANNKDTASITREERDAFNRVGRMRRKGLNPLEQFSKKEEDIFTPEDYERTRSYNRKINFNKREEITQEERESFRKYTRIKDATGESPLAYFREEFLSKGMSPEEMELTRSYARKKHKNQLDLITPEERAARSKQQILRNRGIL